MEVETMERSDTKRKPIFSPGTVVLQYINDDERCIAVVAGDDMISKLNSEDRERFKAFLERGRKCHILLVLSFFRQYREPYSVFYPAPQSFTFPTYIIGDEDVATKADLSAETKLLINHMSEKISNGLNWGKLRNSMFGFSEKQKEALELVGLANHYKKGGQAKDRPDWILFRADDSAEKVVNELAIFCPRKES